MKRCKDFGCSKPQTCKCRIKIPVPIVWTIGGPGSGKTTHCNKIKEKYNFEYIGISDLLRAEIESGSVKGRELEASITDGGPAPDEDVLYLLDVSISKSIAKQSNGFVIDGFPLNSYQGIEFENYIAPVELILYFQCSDKTMYNRIHRKTQQSSQMEIIREKEISYFKENIEEILLQYKDKIVIINAENPIDEISLEVQSAIETVITNKKF